VTTRTHTDDLHLLVATLPQALKDALDGAESQNLLEIVMDLGRIPQARFPGRAINLDEQTTTRADIDQVVSSLGQFGADNRAGIEGTLHRISAIRNRKGQIVGLTLRVGRAVFGTIDLIRDLIESGTSLLLLGSPGIGKTTKLREITRVLADEFGKRVIVIDTSNEIAGDGDVPHPAIGSARRMQVAHPDRQHAVMIEAVENHMPEVIIVDEIGTEAEALAARTIAERGVQLIGTAHGTTLENVLMNPTLSDLVGGIQTVTLGDEEARLRGTQKTISERKAPPTFDAVVEIVDREEVIVHANTARAVDNLLRGASAGGLRRTSEGEERPSSVPPMQAPVTENISTAKRQGPVRIYPYAISRDSVERVIRDLNVDARTVKLPEQADMVISLRARANDPRLRRVLEATGLPVHEVKKNTTAQIRRLLLATFNVLKGYEDHEVQDAVREAETAIQRVLVEGVIIELAPRTASLRKVQHRIVARHHLMAVSEGREPHRHLVIHPS
jgi:stage III sporulation protein SpoIIIAA